jgi:acyl carrier protein
MNKEDVLNRMQIIFREVLDLPELIISSETNAYHIPEWDSIAQIQLVIHIERYFKIQFTAKEIAEIKNVGEMVDAILNKLGKNT